MYHGTLGATSPSLASSDVAATSDELLPSPFGGQPGAGSLPVVVQTQSFSHAAGAVDGDFHHAEMACCMVLPPTEIWFQMPANNDIIAAILRRMQPRWQRYRGGSPLIGRGTWAALVEAKLELK